MSKNPLTSCSKYNQCYFTHSIKSLIDEYREYADNLDVIDVRYWADFQRGAHFGRIALANNLIDDLEAVLVTLDPNLTNNWREFVKV